MGITTYFGLPYPASSGPVASGAANIQSLATDTELALYKVQATAGLRNRLINGSMEFWQRGTTAVTTSNTYSADRWVVNRATSTVSVTRATVAPNAQTPGPIRFATAYTVTTGGTSTSYAQLAQRIEDVGTLAGSTVTVSFYAYASAANLEIACSLQQVFGTGGTPSAAVPIYAYTARKTSSLSTSLYARYEFSFTVPNIALKVRGTNGDDYLNLILWLDAGSTYNTETDTLGNQSGTFYITGVQLERSPGPSSFEERPRQVELALCQRYYEKTYALATAPGTATSTGVYIFGGCTEAFSLIVSTINFRVPKRSTAYSLSFFDTAGAAVWAWNRSGASGTGAVTATAKSETNFYCYVSAGAPYVVAVSTGHWVASDEL
jgi:hypothetical protein